MEESTKLIQRKAAAAILGVSGQTVDNYRKRGYLHAIQYMDKGVYRYDREEVMLFAAGRAH